MYNLDYLHPSLTMSRGAGGLGCEILKNLALSGFKDIHVIDMGRHLINSLRQALINQIQLMFPTSTVNFYSVNQM
jgi:NEDD8-activating enzyme E1